MPRMTAVEYQAYEARRKPKVAPPSEGVDLEGKLHAEIIDYCNRQWPQWVFIHARMDRESTIGNGAPDFILLLPNGKTLLIECKRRGGKVSVEQAAWHARASALGHTVHVVYSMGDLLKLV